MRASLSLLDHVLSLHRAIIVTIKTFLDIQRKKLNWIFLFPFTYSVCIPFALTANFNIHKSYSQRNFTYRKKLQLIFDNWFFHGPKILQIDHSLNMRIASPCRHVVKKLSQRTGDLRFVFEHSNLRLHFFYGSYLTQSFELWSKLLIFCLLWFAIGTFVYGKPNLDSKTSFPTQIWRRKKWAGMAVLISSKTSQPSQKVRSMILKITYLESGDSEDSIDI